MGISPSQELLLGQRWKLFVIADTSLFGQELRKRQTARKVAASGSQGGFHATPLLAA
jgi:hypothetical protein